MAPLPYMDHLETPLNPCTVESIPPIRLANGHCIWPVVVGCYELQSSGDNGATSSQRYGRADLYAVSVPNIAGDRTTAPPSTIPLHLSRPPLTFYEGPSGILDGKWTRLRKYNTTANESNNTIPEAIASSPSSLSMSENIKSSPSNTGNGDDDFAWIYCTAQSTGEIRAYELVIFPAPAPGLPLLDTDPLYEIRPVGMTTSTASNSDDDSSSPLCLSINWNAAHNMENSDTVGFTTVPNNNAHHDNEEDGVVNSPEYRQQLQTDSDSSIMSQQIVSTYSNGHIAIHDVAYINDSVQFVLRDCWLAHFLPSFGVRGGQKPIPAEVWSAAFATTRRRKRRGSKRPSAARNNSDTTNKKNDTASTLIVSCGDDGAVKLWDIRCTRRPVHTFPHLFEAGATCASQHPRHNHLVVCGSYDASICLLDLSRWSNGNSGDNGTTIANNTSNNSSPATSMIAVDRKTNLGGGIWRLQWHPLRDDRLLVAAMHGGCRVVKIRDFRSIIRSKISATKTLNKKEIINTTSLLPSEFEIVSSDGDFGATSSDDNVGDSGGSASLPSDIETPTASDDDGEDNNRTAVILSPLGPTVNDLHHPCFRVRKKFTEHESMAYGAAWLTCRHPTHPNGYFEAAVSCSFYDRNVFVWDTLF